VYNFVGGAWTFEEELIEGVGEKFGTSLSQMANRIAVGAPFHINETEQVAGGVYIYDYSGGNCTKTAVKTGISSGDQFGASVALFTDSSSGNWLVVGAPGVSGGGAVYVYKYNVLSCEWDLDGTLVPSDNQNGAPLGGSIAITQTSFDNKLWVFAGRPLHDSNMDCIQDLPGQILYWYNGIVEIFENTILNGWELKENELRPPDCFVDGNFGFSVDASNDQIAVGSPGAKRQLRVIYSLHEILPYPTRHIN
jgi:hypothetical protein